MNAEKIAIAATLIVNINAGNCNQMFATDATSNKMTPANNHLPRPSETSFLTVVASVAMPAPPGCPDAPDAPEAKTGVLDVSQDLIDRHGLVRFEHTGEGAYEATELMIQQLLREIHPYEVPEWIVVRAGEVGEKYLSWAGALPTNPPL